MNGSDAQSQSDEENQKVSSSIPEPLRSHFEKQEAEKMLREMGRASTSKRNDKLLNFDEILETHHQVEYADEIIALEEVLEKESVDGFMDIYAAVRNADDDEALKMYSLIELLREKGVLEVGRMLRTQEGNLLQNTFGMASEGKWPRKVKAPDGQKLDTKKLKTVGAIKLKPC